MNQIYQREQFKIYRVKNGYILHNSEKEFNSGHTHLRNIRECKLLIEYSLKKEIPYHISGYLMQSLYRINKGDYAEEISKLMPNRPKNNYKGVYKNDRSKSKRKRF